MAACAYLQLPRKRGVGKFNKSNFPLERNFYHEGSNFDSFLSLSTYIKYIRSIHAHSKCIKSEYEPPLLASENFVNKFSLIPPPHTPFYFYIHSRIMYKYTGHYVIVAREPTGETFEFDFGPQGSDISLEGTNSFKNFKIHRIHTRTFPPPKI